MVPVSPGIFARVGSRVAGADATVCVAVAGDGRRSAERYATRAGRAIACEGGTARAHRVVAGQAGGGRTTVAVAAHGQGHADPPTASAVVRVLRDAGSTAAEAKDDRGAGGGVGNGHAGVAGARLTLPAAAARIAAAAVVTAGPVRAVRYARERARGRRRRDAGRVSAATVAAPVELSGAGDPAPPTMAGVVLQVHTDGAAELLTRSQPGRARRRGGRRRGGDRGRRSRGDGHVDEPTGHVFAPLDGDGHARKVDRREFRTADDL